MYHFTNLHEAEAALEPYYPSNLKRFAFTTEHIAQFMDYIGNPQDKPRSIHIAGTSGKTSTAYYAASLLQQAGKRVGLLVSPHVDSINERVQIDLQPLPEREFCDELAIFMDVVEKSSITLTYAEIMYAFAFWEFARQHVDYIVVEVGMGGLLDATNVINRDDKTCIITDIGKDHTLVLGDTLQQITEHKAGIIHLHNTVFCHAQDLEIMNEIRNVCRKHQADLTIVDGHEYPSQPNIQFLPLFQRRNFALALEAITRVLSKESHGLSSEEISLAAEVHIPGRMEMKRQGQQTLIIDGAHNPQKLRMLCKSIEDSFPGSKAAILVAFVAGRGRSVKEMMAELAPIAGHVIVTTFTTAQHPAGSDPEEVLSACKEVGITSCEIITSQKDAYNTLLQQKEPVLLLTGSLYLVSQMRSLTN